MNLPPNDETEYFVMGLRPYWRRMLVGYEAGTRIEHLYLDFYGESLRESDVYGIVSYMWLTGRWLIRETAWRYEDRIRPTVLTFIRPTDWAKHEALV
jgi:hypothetical protein